VEDGAVKVEWGDYEARQLQSSGPLQDLPRREARAEYQRTLATIPSRIAVLRALVGRNGVTLDDSDASIQQLNDWFRLHVERNPEAPGRLMARWYAVANDIGVYLSEVILQRAPGLRWEFFTHGRANVSYQRPVIMGFAASPNLHYNLDADLNVVTYAQHLVGGGSVDPKLFVKMVQGALEKA
jgi:hypothetical protein